MSSHFAGRFANPPINRLSNLSVLGTAIGLSLATSLIAHVPSVQAQVLPIMANSCTSRGNGTYICTFDNSGKRPGPQAYRSYDGQVTRMGKGWIPNGYGILVFESDNRYEGQMRNGLDRKSTRLNSSHVD